MNLRVRFSLILAIIVTTTILISSIVSLKYLGDVYRLIVNAPNHGLVAAMADRIFIKAALSYGLIILCFILLSIPVSIWFSKAVSRPYFEIIKGLYDRACDRLKVDPRVNLQKNERVILQQYVDVLQADFTKLQDYEKIKSWKNGARLLMHELKNPLTPLKLSAQRLLLQEDKPDTDKSDITRIINSIKDIENILRYFKDLVNVEFGRKELLDIVPLFQELMDECGTIFPGLQWKGGFSRQSIQITAEPTLLKMLFMNLIRNGMEQNSRDFYMTAGDSGGHIFFEFITPGVVIKETDRLFGFAYSTKGTQRGYGLFLCKMIADYLSFSLSVENKPQGLVFAIGINT